MYKVDRNLLELQNNADMEMLLSLILKWTKKSDSKELKVFNDALFRQLRYIQALEDERFSFDRIVSESIADKIRAVERARKADERIEELEKQIKILETKKSLGSLITLNFEPAHAAPLPLTSWLVLNLLNLVFLSSLIEYSPL